MVKIIKLETLLAADMYMQLSSSILTHNLCNVIIQQSCIVQSITMNLYTSYICTVTDHTKKLNRNVNVFSI